MVARLSRIIPLLLVLAFIAGVVYLVVTFRYSASKAKEVLLRAFTWLTGSLSAAFLLLALYALGERNEAVFELWASFFATAAIGLAITRICHAVFIRNHPHYKRKPVKSKPINRHWWDVFFDFSRRR